MPDYQYIQLVCNKHVIEGIGITSDMIILYSPGFLFRNMLDEDAVATDDVDSAVVSTSTYTSSWS
jgi:hypothetical protein